MDYIFDERQTIRQALRQLNRVKEAEKKALRRLNTRHAPFAPLVVEPTLTLLVVDSRGNFRGTFTDGDARRHLERRSAKLDDPIKKARRSDLKPYQIRRGAAQKLHTIYEALGHGGVRILPELDGNEIVNIVDLRPNISPYTATRSYPPHDQPFILPHSGAVIDVYIMNDGLKAVTVNALQERVFQHLRVNVSGQLLKIKKLAGIPRSEFPFLVESASLDDYFVALQEAMSWLKSLGLINGSSAVVQAREVVKKQIDELLEWYHGRIRSENSAVGVAAAIEKPDVVIVLGCADEAEMARRRKIAEEIIRNGRGRKIRLVLSGGGVRANSEASVMKQKWQGVPIDFLLEEDSLDTVGNAVFCRLRLLRNLKPKSKVCVVTSDYHALRTLRIFKIVFGDCDVGIAPAYSSSKGVATWLESEWHATHGSLALYEPWLERWSQIPAADWQSVAWQMMLTHRLYRNRIDLFRKNRSSFARAFSDGGRGRTTHR